MLFQLDERLSQYMKEHRQKDILITPQMCNTWGGPVLDISARFVDPDEAASLKEANFHSFPHSFGSVFIHRIPLSAEDTVTLGLSRFFKRITVNGIYSV